MTDSKKETIYYTTHFYNNIFTNSLDGNIDLDSTKW